MGTQESHDGMNQEGRPVSRRAALLRGLHASTKRAAPAVGTIELVAPNVVKIDGTPITMPASLAEFEAVLGPASREVTFKAAYRTVYAFDAQGIVLEAIVGNDSWFRMRGVDRGPERRIIELIVYPGPKVRRYSQETVVPSRPCDARLVERLPNGSLSGIWHYGDRAEVGDFHLITWCPGHGTVGRDDGHPAYPVTISYWPDVVHERPRSYAIRKPVEPVLTFDHLAFKLAVVQVLMYDLMVLAPYFDLAEYAESYRGKTPIDLESDVPVKPALDWFRRLPVPARLAAQVEEIYMDGGNEVYLNLVPQWDGEDSFGLFDLDEVSARELAQFPNLKKATILSSRYEEVAGVFRAAGVEVRPL